MDVKELTGLKADSQHDLRDITRRLCYFSAKGSQNYVNELIEFLTLNVFTKLPSGAHPTAEIYNKLRELINFDFEYEQIFAALRRLQSKKKIYVENDYSDQEVLFGLHVSQTKELKTKYRNQVEFENRVIEQWHSEIKSRNPDLRDDELDILDIDLETFSLRLFSMHSMESVLLYFGGDQNVNGLLAKMDKEALDEILPKRNSKIDNIRRYELPRFFKNASVDRKIYISQQLSQVFLLHMMQLDATCARLAQTTITGGVLFLDTNFLIRLLGIDGPELQNASKRLIELSRGLGYRAVITPRTLDEYDVTIGELVKKAKHLPPIAPKVAKAALSVTLGNDFYTHYWERSEEEKAYLTRPGYYEVYKNIEPFLEEYNVSVDFEDVDGAIRNDSIALAQEEAVLFNALDPYRPSEWVVEHDAHHRLLILRLRAGYEEKSPLEIPYWFLTCDTKLPVYDRRARWKGDLKTPYCVLSSHWMQLLRPFATAVEDFDLIQASTLDSPLFRSFDAPPTELIQDIVDRMSWASSEQIPPSVAVKIITNDVFVQAFSRTYDSKKRDEMLQDQVLTEVTNLLEEERKKLEQEREKVGESNTELNSKFLNLEMQHSDLLKKFEASEADRKLQISEKAQLERNFDKLERAYSSVEEELREAQRRQREDILEKERMGQRIEILDTELEQLKKLSSKRDELEGLVKELKQELDSERTKHERGTGIAIGAIAVFGLIVVFVFPSLFSWEWLINHPHRIGLQLCLAYMVIGITWMILDPPRRKFVFMSIIFATLIAISQIA